MAVVGNLQVTQHDFVTAFLNAPTDAELYMELPPGINRPRKVAKLLKTLYGLKQSPRLWFQALGQALKDLGLHQLPSEPSVFAGIYQKVWIVIAVYVDDLLIIGPADGNASADLAQKLGERFKLTNLGPCSYFLGVKITRNLEDGWMHLSQQAYLEKLLSEFKLDSTKPAETPMEAGHKLTASATDAKRLSPYNTVVYQRMIGSLMYAMTQTRPDIALAVSVLSRALDTPGRCHYAAAQRVLRYLKGTIDQGITFRRPRKAEVRDAWNLTYLGLKGYVDAEYAGDIATRRSTGAYIFTAAGAPVSWAARRQQIVTLSSTEAEYVALTEAAQEAIWLRRLLEEIGVQGVLPKVDLLNDNIGAAALARNPEYHSRTKHIDVRWHWIREAYERGEIELPYVATGDNLADGLTKALTPQKFYVFSSQIVGRAPGV